MRHHTWTLVLFSFKTATILNAPLHVNPGTTGPHRAAVALWTLVLFFIFLKKLLFRMRHHTWTLVRQGLIAQAVALEPRGLAGLGIHDHFAPLLAVAGVQHEALLPHFRVLVHARRVKLGLF